MIVAPRGTGAASDDPSAQAQMAIDPAATRISDRRRRVKIRVMNVLLVNAVFVRWQEA
jgi:hypothetical protein